MEPIRRILLPPADRNGTPNPKLLRVRKGHKELFKLAIFNVPEFEVSRLRSKKSGSSPLVPRFPALSEEQNRSA